MAEQIRFDDAALALRSQRMAIIASNIANADTPGYKARDISFSQALSDATRPTLSMQQTQAGHISTPLRSTVSLDYRMQSQPAMDGNSVDMDQERATFVDNAIKTQMSFQFAMEEYLEAGNLIRSLKD